MTGIVQRKLSKKVKKKEDPNSPVYSPLASMMTVDFRFNDEGGVWLVHDAPLPALLHWVEYDCQTRRVTLISTNGKVQDLGFDIPETADECLPRAQRVTVMYMKDDKIEDFAMVPILTRRGTVN